MLSLADKYELIDIMNTPVIGEQFSQNELDYIINLVEQDIEKEEDK